MLSIYSNKKTQLGAENQKVLDDLFEEGPFGQIDNFMIRSSYLEIMQFFAPHLFFNLACWGMRKMNDLMNDVKHQIEQMTPSEYRASRDTNIEKILRSHQAWDAGLSVQANLELLDEVAFGLADFYQEYRNRLFFPEDILRKQYEELSILERADAQKKLRAKNLFLKKSGGSHREKTRFEKMAEEMGLFFEPEQVVQDNIEEGEDLDEQVGLLKEFLEENGVGGKYLESLRDLSEIQKKQEDKEDASFAQNQQTFGRSPTNHKPPSISRNRDSRANRPNRECSNWTKW